MLVLFLSSVILYLSDAYLKKNNLLKCEFPLLINFSVFGMMIVISSNDLMTLYLGIEIQSLSLYIIAAYRRDNIKSTEAGLKYFILGRYHQDCCCMVSLWFMAQQGQRNFTQYIKQ